MPDYQPAIVLPPQPGNFKPKPGGGSVGSPLVQVDADLRTGLVSQLSSVNAIIQLNETSLMQGAPLAIRLREQALSKSNRPYALLDQADLTPVAGQSQGEMISRATPENTRLLSQLISTRTSKRDVFAISTFETFRVWDTLTDALPLEYREAPERLFQDARTSDLPLRIELYPWLSPQSRWGGPRSTQTLSGYLESIGLPIVAQAGSANRRSLYLRVTDDATTETFARLQGIRSASLTPTYSAKIPIVQQSFRPVSRSVTVGLPKPQQVGPLVGVLDSGVAPGVLDPWVLKSFPYDVGPDLDPTHGTFVAGLVVASRALNANSVQFPADPAHIYDGQVLSQNGNSEDVLIERISEVLVQSGPQGPRVWNCSFNNSSHMDPVQYGTLSQELDLLSAKHGVLFVQSAGNYDALRTVWPPDGSAGPADGIANPGESVYGLTVGSLSHLGGVTPIGAVASYSRRGPGFGGQQKPEVGFWSGDVDNRLALSGYGIQSVGPGDVGLESVGTSFATPIVSAIAANIWADLTDGGAIADVTPELVKGLVVHNATVQNMDIDDDHRAYFGAGVPHGEAIALFDDSHTFTTIHEVELRTGVNWFKRPFPMPECLFEADRKLRGAVSLTLAYAPVIDPAFGDESVRTCVEPSFGFFSTKNGKETFDGKMGGSHDWERNLVERGKWAPVKSYRKVWPNGIGGGGEWSLKLTLTARDKTIEPVTQRAYVILTMEGLDRSQPVYLDGLDAINHLRYPSSLAVDVAQLRVST